MTNSKHTPGPWKCVGIRPYSNLDGKIKVHLNQPYYKYGIEQTLDTKDGGRITTFIADVVRCGHMSDEELNANARLIVAAPDMETGLEFVNRSYQGHVTINGIAAVKIVVSPDQWDAIQAALAKAQGGENE